VNRIDLQALLEEGGTVTLEYDPGQSGRCDDQGDVIDEPIDPAFVVSALGWDGAIVGSGSGRTLAEALLRVYRRRPGPGWDDNGPYSDDPPCSADNDCYPLSKGQGDLSHQVGSRSNKADTRVD
jgi:hypothetical protein